VRERDGLAPLEESAHAGVGCESSGEGTRWELRGVRRRLLSTRTQARHSHHPRTFARSVTAVPAGVRRVTQAATLGVAQVCSGR
jgi:hypothetical protein